MDVLSHPLIKKRLAEVQDNVDLFRSNGFTENNFCPMPFLNIILEPNGSVGLCRHKGTEHSLGNLKQQSWQEIWNGALAQKWRNEFLEGKPQTCSNELQHQKCNMCPELGKLYSQQASLKLNTSIDRPVRLTANFNGQCNLECQMCDVWQLPNGNYTEKNFWEMARIELFPYLKEIDMLSGEPLIQKDTYKLIDEVSLLNPECLWSITTNAHWRLNKKITDALDKVKIKNLILSVDSFDNKTYAKIRKKGNLSIVLKSIEDLREYEKSRIERNLTPLNMNLNFLIQKDNWYEMSHTIDFCLDKDIHPFLTFCYRPNQFSLLSFDEKKRKEIIEHLLNSYNWDKLSLCHRITSPLIKSLSPIDQALYYSHLFKIKQNYIVTRNAKKQK